MTPLKRFNNVYLLVLALLISGSSTRAVEAHVTVDRTGTNFTYTLFNDEPANSTAHLDAFHLVINAPIVVAASPAGWSFDTDNFSYIDWFSTNSTPPYTHDIAPGASLGGFAIRSELSVELPSSELLNYALAAWDHGTTNSAAGSMGSVEVPSILTVEAHLTAAMTNNTFRLTVSGVPASTYIVEASADLQAWTPIMTNASSFTYVKTNGGSLPHDFFRAVFESGYSIDEPDAE